MPPDRRLLFGAGALVALGAGAVALWPAGGSDPIRGAALYADRCAACHGANREGAPDWRSPGPGGRLPAPPHDATGHTWRHADDVLFGITKYGSAAVVGGGRQSDMPGFGAGLSGAEIRDALAHIASGWPPRERAHQAEATRRAGG